MTAENEQKPTPISALGEFGLIRRLTQNLKPMQPGTVRSIGDDAAVLNYGDERTVVSTDMFVEGVHFDLLFTPLMHLGYKCVVGSISDVVAMGATPRHIFVNIALSNKYSVEMVEEVYKGIRTACKNYRVDLAGGDTSASHSGMMISITAMGSAPEEQLSYRSGAKPGDKVVVSGDLGGSYVGLQVLEREKRVMEEEPEIKPELEGFEYVLQRQLRPEARMDIMELLRKNKIHPTSMIDISDGLGSEMLHLCEESKVGCTIYEEHIPMDPATYNTAVEFSLDSTVCALNGGEDYELLFTVSAEDGEKLENDPDVTVIGEVTEAGEGRWLITRGGNKIELEAGGWNAFRE